MGSVVAADWVDGRYYSAWFETGLFALTHELCLHLNTFVLKSPLPSRTSLTHIHGFDQIFCSCQGATNYHFWLRLSFRIFPTMAMHPLPPRHGFASSSEKLLPRPSAALPPRPRLLLGGQTGWRAKSLPGARLETVAVDDKQPRYKLRSHYKSAPAIDQGPPQVVQFRLLALEGENQSPGRVPEKQKNHPTHPTSPHVPEKQPCQQPHAIPDNTRQRRGGVSAWLDYRRCHTAH